jgi:hypothetical protein
MTSHDWESMNTYTWRIESLEYAVTAEGLPNVVTHIHWRLFGTSSEKYASNTTSNLSDSSTATVVLAPYTGQAYGCLNVPFNPNKTFINYSDLSEEIVIGWLKSIMSEDDIAKLKSQIDAQIAAQVNPTTGSGLPWSN